MGTSTEGRMAQDNMQTGYHRCASHVFGTTSHNVLSRSMYVEHEQDLALKPGEAQPLELTGRQ